MIRHGRPNVVHQISGDDIGGSHLRDDLTVLHREVYRQVWLRSRKTADQLAALRLC